MKQISYLALALALIALILSSFLLIRSIQANQLETRLEAVEILAATQQAQIVEGYESVIDDVEVEYLVTQAKSDVLQAKVELVLREDFSAALNEIENAEQKLVEARLMAETDIQSMLDAVMAEVALVKADLQAESDQALDRIQVLLENWEDQLTLFVSETI